MIVDSPKKKKKKKKTSLENHLFVFFVFILAVNVTLFLHKNYSQTKPYEPEIKKNLVHDVFRLGETLKYRDFKSKVCKCRRIVTKMLKTIILSMKFNLRFFMIPKMITNNMF